ncbi:hypothetical protein EIP86_005033 [Pleurotus ostreatoroseus]|nr:hypothetical protein EIP86_005033 [Pleurotus ostreatoroseus]
MPSFGSTPSPDSAWARGTRYAKKIPRKVVKAVMRSHHVRIPKYDMPIRFRPWFLVFTCIVMIILGVLGFSNLSHALPLNDKLLHFFCLMLATGIFYFIFDVEEDARRIWIWRSAPLMLTCFMCLFLGGVMSEFVQAMLPYKEFQFGDIVISQLYRPLGTDPESSDEEDDLEAGTQLLPTHADPTNRSPTKPNNKVSRLADVWDEGEELFDIGADSDDETSGPAPRTPAPHLPGPKIVVTNSS